MRNLLILTITLILFCDYSVGFATTPDSKPEGKCVEGDCQDSQGIFIDPSDIKLEGKFKNSQLIEGIMYWPHGDKWKEGKFNNGMFIEGTLYSILGDKWIGKFKNDWLVEGIKYRSDGSKEAEGKFSDGSLLIEGIEYDYQGNKYFEGKFDKGILVDGITYIDGKQYEKGRFKNGELINGTLNLTNGHTLFVKNGEWFESIFDRRWKYVTDTKDLTVFYDTKTIITTNKKTKVWTKFVKTNRENSKDLMELDCNSRTSRTLQSTSYNSEGNVIISLSSPTEWTSIIPDTIGETIFSILCKKK